MSDWVFSAATGAFHEVLFRFRPKQLGLLGVFQIESSLAGGRFNSLRP